MKNDITEIISALRKFNKDRDWEQFHNPKDLAIAINLESSELLERFLWKSNEEADIEGIEDELADVFNYSFILADRLNLDILEIMRKKIKKNAQKYPIEKAKGTSDKYDKI